MYHLDSSHIWHVAKSGNDGNSGHAGQYPVNLANDAKLTIGAAVAAAANGDIIVIWPGDYVETVNLDSTNKGLRLIGTHRDLCRITPDADDAIVIEDNTQLHNLSFITEVTGKRGIEGANKNNIIINNCYSYGPYDGLFLSSCTNVRLTNSYFKSTYDGANIGNKGFFIDGCIFETNGASVGVLATALILGNHEFDDLGMLVRNTIARAVRTDASSQKCYAIMCKKGKVILENCDLVAVTKASAAGDASALLAGFMSVFSSEWAIKNCNFYSSSIAGTASDIEAFNSSKIALSNCVYDRTKVSKAGSASVVDLSQDAAKAAKVLLNKAVQNKITGAIDYYDDDGETIILTHTPSDNESTIERTPG